MTSSPLTYRSAGVSYETLDTLKRLAQLEGKKSAVHTELKEVSQSRGESAYVWEEKDCYRALVIEGLGTKNLIADAMRKITARTYYDAIAQDTVAMIVNDLIVVGAKPQVVNAYFGVGNSDWFSDKKRAGDLVTGWAKACKLAGAVWGGGETPTLKDIIKPDTIDLAGSAIGIIKPKRRLILGDKLTAGDAILLIESNGIHANGLTLARAIAQKFPRGYATKLPSGSRYGEALLRPTHIYTQIVEDLFLNGIEVHYMVHITGHGWRKLMRANRSFRYIIDDIGKVPPIFGFIQTHSGMNDRDMYATFNMGAGFALFVPSDEREKAQRIIARNKLACWRAGTVKNGPKQVLIRPKAITFSAGSLRVRP
ncbi:phosphoribosylformylglycinamidine cyclo-ligase [Candidatus Gottesmanbacteria bacterium]|nr:phosphoribosylformylglycinamidine cyclo-ligase [Candidatus Gottesmanbacteria bacterium]